MVTILINSLTNLLTEAQITKLDFKTKVKKKLVFKDAVYKVHLKLFSHNLTLKSFK